MNDRLLEHDLQRLLQTLRVDGPKTVNELQQSLRLTSARISSLLHTLEQKGLVQAPRMTTGKKGLPVNVWEVTETPS